MADSTDTSGGLLGGLTNNPLLYLAAGLLSQRGAGSSLGAGLLQGMGAYQQNRAANQQNQMQQLAMRQKMAEFGLLQRYLPGGGGQQPEAPPAPPQLTGLTAPTVAANAASAMPGIMAGTPAAPAAQSGMPAPQQSPQPDPFAVPTRQQVFGNLADLPPAIGLFGGMGSGLGEVRKNMQVRAQEQYSQPIRALDTAITSGNARALVQSNPAYGNVWQAYAANNNLDPTKDLTENNARIALADRRNSIAGVIGAPATPPKLAAYEDPKTHLLMDPETGKPLEGMKNAIVGGRESFVPEHSSGGLMPGNPFNVGGNVGQDAMEGWYQQFVATGKIPAGIPPGAKNAALAYIQQRAQQQGVDATGLQVGATVRTQAAKAAGGNVGRIAVASNELAPFGAQAVAASDAVPRGIWKPGTRLSQWVGASFNDPALINFKAKMQTLENAFEQLAARSGMDSGKRAHIMDLFDTATSPEGVKTLAKALNEESAGAQQGAQGAVREIAGMGRPGAPPPPPPALPGAAARPAGGPPPVPARATQPQKPGAWGLNESRQQRGFTITRVQ